MSFSLDGGPDLAELAELDEVASAAYQHAVRAGRFQRREVLARLHLTTDEVARVERVLRSLCLLHPMAEDGTLVPVSPDAAVVALVGSTERQIHELQESVTEARARLLSLLPCYLEGRRARSQCDAVDVVLDTGTAQLMIEEITDRCKSEVLTMQPGGPPLPAQLAEARRTALGLLGRGVRVRTLYQHTVRTDTPTSSLADELTDVGAHIRTTTEIADQFTVYDGEIAFLPGDSSCVVVREPTVLALLTRIFDQHWARATPYPSATGQTDHTGDEIKAAIVRIMAEGHKDEVVARRIGMSLRTTRRHIAELMDELQATSRFQTGVNAIRSGLLLPPEADRPSSRPPK
ncbi:hypothetical protein [Streptomyces sp. AC512_CC834]|uniref:hypothetical protein n=1 Tax=Streptomyces sp. AC512_CC834 TaxID=2823691 RepID=UPI001C27938E|nr:hypothetical protein [Streptomyces sp. AC512_CC834]